MNSICFCFTPTFPVKASLWFQIDVFPDGRYPSAVTSVAAGTGDHCPQSPTPHTPVVLVPPQDYIWRRSYFSTLAIGPYNTKTLVFECSSPNSVKLEDCRKLIKYRFLHLFRLIRQLGSFVNKPACFSIVSFAHQLLQLLSQSTYLQSGSLDK